MRHLAILGRQPELSCTELCSVASAEGFHVLSHSRSMMVLDGVRDAAVLMKRLGGTVKIAEVLDEIGTESLQSPQTVRMLAETLPPAGKAVFGISVYDASAAVIRNAQDLAVQLKKYLKESGRSARYIRGEHGILSSVVVQKQGLLDHGSEFILSPNGDRLLIGRTIVVQPFEEYSKRDYGRPGRNVRAGMLPPKLARMMVNLAGVPTTAVFYDPFCGSGTVLQEAYLLGFSNLLGSDSNKRAVEETQKNLTWIASSNEEKAKTQVFQSDIRSATRHIQPGTVDAIVTEPFLGPPLSGDEDRGKIHSLQRELFQMYKDAFSIFHALLAPKGRVVVVLPVFFHGKERLFLEGIEQLLEENFRFHHPLTRECTELFSEDLSFRKTIIYHRPDQRLGREILILERA